MDINAQIEYWKSSANHDIGTAEALFYAEKYDWCLYIGHIVLEKSIKAIYVKNREATPPKSHKLDYLADEAKILLPQDKLDYLKIVNQFNLEARYPDYKQSFYDLCTKEFTTEHFFKN